ncbi:unnamed protein product [Effrenium voratum]|uniref:Carrier domain-containing protein n=1 Tax=Effrenium voratum TaxID=2562239 RepID=A0AA36N9Q9_9DINO|nr:unnamed protein product [Effrenium voratum]CAJ1448603.1 unnamed protein product [Effrenium voratum]
MEQVRGTGLGPKTGTSEPWPLQLFDAWARSSPGQEILRCEALALTGGELLARSERLAQLLRPGPFVAVCLPRGAGLVVALLAVWRAGKAYVPLEPSYPLPRLRFILEDCQASLVLVERSTEPRGLCEDGRLLRLSWPGGEPEGLEAPLVQGPPEEPTHLAYLIYTSGSTGQPKGVLVSQAAVCNVLHAFNGALRPEEDPSDVLVSVTTFCFDISVLEMFWPLCFGFRLVLCSLAVARSGGLLRSALEGVRGARLIFQATPSSYRALLQAGWSGGPHVTAICGGEAFPTVLAGPLHQNGAAWNAYGPTEATVWCAAHRLTDADTNGAPVPIGGPVAGMQLFVEGDAGDDGGEVEGELLIGGVGLAEGYLKRPELTAQKFRPGPLGRRVFCSGDLVRRREGLLWCLGRRDHQVKIRGFRLELGEVEATLEAQPEVRGAVALVLEGELLAVVAAAGPPPALRASLRAALAALPSYAVPRRLAALEALPLLPSGKVDRRALQEQAEQGRLEFWPLADTDERGAEVRPLREVVIESVAMVTGVTIEDNTEEFVSLGIDSMSAVPLAELLSVRLLQSAELPLEDLYVYNTLQALCGYLQGRMAELTSEQAPPQATKTKTYAQLKKSRARDTKEAVPMLPGLEACRDGNLSLLREVLEEGSFDVHATDRFGGSGLHWAASGGHLEVCRLLVEHQALVGYADKKSGRMALHWAARQGKLEVVQWLVLEHGLPVDAQTKDCTTPFQLGAWGGHVEVCQWLLLKKADLWHQNSWSCLAHHFAALAGMEACCRWLRQQGLDLGTPNNQGHNALHKAAYGGHAALCQWLQDEVDLDPAECDVRGQNAAALARKAGFEDLAQRLEQA